MTMAMASGTNTGSELKSPFNATNVSAVTTRSMATPHRTQGHRDRSEAVNGCAAAGTAWLDCAVHEAASPGGGHDLGVGGHHHHGSLSHAGPRYDCLSQPHEEHLA